MHFIPNTIQFICNFPDKIKYMFLIILIKLL